MDAPEPLLVKFAKTIYENPLILLLCGSAGVSAVMGNIDDAVSITVAVLIVLTGELHSFWSPLANGFEEAALEKVILPQIANGLLLAH